jgi:GH15 family glucan-1,4-alpha-glucosidase
MADYYLALAKARDDLARVIDILTWTLERALPSGVLAEQLDPITGQHLSVSPLTWSHSTFVATVNCYLAKLKELKDQTS